MMGGFASSETCCSRLIIRCRGVVYQDSLSEMTNMIEPSPVKSLLLGDWTTRSPHAEDAVYQARDTQHCLRVCSFAL